MLCSTFNFFLNAVLDEWNTFCCYCCCAPYFVLEEVKKAKISGCSSLTTPFQQAQKFMHYVSAVCWNTHSVET